VIVDLRGNGGGNSEVIAPLLKGLSNRPALAEHGRIFALIDRRTFSSALMNSIQLRDQAHAVLIGEPTGGRPNHYGEVRTFRLPNSGLTVFHSTKYFTMQAEDTPSLMPHITVKQSSADYLAGRDPVLAAALTQPVK
jgi:C-terminal processing protease CtpA/Prc